MYNIWCGQKHPAPYTCPDFHTSNTGIPAMMELGSSWAAEFTVSLAPITRVRSVSGKSSFISSISNTTSYGIPASAGNIKQPQRIRILLNSRFLNIFSWYSFWNFFKPYLWFLLSVKISYFRWVLIFVEFALLTFMSSVLAISVNIANWKNAAELLISKWIWLETWNFKIVIFTLPYMVSPKERAVEGGINTNKHYCTCDQSLELDFSPDAAASQKIEFC